MIRSMRSLTILAIAAALPAVEPLVLARSSGWDLGWDPLLAAQAEPDLVLGGSGVLQPVASGFWGGVQVRGQIASQDDGDRAWTAATPDHTGARGRLELGLAGGVLSVVLRPELRWADDPKAADQDGSLDLVPGGTLVVPLLFNTVGVVSSEPVQWGPAIFGGLLFSGGDRGFSHGELLMASPFAGLELLGDPVFLSLEGLIGSTDRDQLFSGPTIAAARVAARWRWLSLGAARRWRPSDSGVGEPLVRTAVEAVVDPGRVRLATSLGFDPAVTLPGDNPVPLIVTIDAYDLSGEGGMRLALEWHHAMTAAGADSAYLTPWTAASTEPRAGSADSFHLLWSHRPNGEDWRYDLSPSLILGREDEADDDDRLRLDARLAFELDPVTCEWSGFVSVTKESRRDQVDGGGSLSLGWRF